MITNHAYLDNPTFRGLRWHLAKTFDKIFVLDLHGNVKKKEVALDGSKDENVFDIMQGVAIILAIRTQKHNNLAEVYYSELFGLREKKFHELDNGLFEFQSITLDPKMFFFVIKNTAGKSDYEQGVSITELFSLNSVGVVTAADSILISSNKNTLIQNITDAKQNSKNGKVFNRLSNRVIDENNVKPISYRPFDEQFIYYDTKVIERPRENVMRNYILGNNIGLVFKRGGVEEKSPPIFLVKNISESRAWSRPGMEGIEFNAPLYVYDLDGTRSINMQSNMLELLTHNLSGECSPEDLIDYIYGALHSPSYREKFQEFLKIDFPRIPIPTQAEFDRLVPLGRELRELHLMQSPVIDDFETTFPVPGDCLVEKITYSDEGVWINKTQYFGNVPELAWNFYIGGYQPAQKWLKDRKGRQLSDADLVHYQRIIKILLETDRVMKLIG